MRRQQASPSAGEGERREDNLDGIENDLVGWPKVVTCQILKIFYLLFFCLQQLAKRLQLEEIAAQRKRKREVELRRAQQQPQQGGRETARGGERVMERGGGREGPSVTQSLRQPVDGGPRTSHNPERTPSPRRDTDPTQSRQFPLCIQRVLTKL